MENTKDLTRQVKKSGDNSIDTGGFSDIWLGILQVAGSNTLENVVIKVPRGHSAAKALKRNIRELKVWSEVKHPNIIPLLGISWDFARPDSPCLVFPYLRHGSIVKYLNENRDVDKIALITQTANALSYLHSISVVHGDVKGSNVLITDDCKACITDLGLARILEQPGFTTTTASTTFRFMSPEQIPHDEEEEVIPRPTKATDVWAFSMFIIQVLTQRLPYSNITSAQGVVVHIAKGGLPRRKRCPEIDDEIWRVLEMCWVDPERRPPMAELLNFFQSQPSLRSSSANSNPELEGA